jgi:hypothetical protein
MNGILVYMNGANSAKHYYVFSVAHGVVGRYENETEEVEHRDARLLLLQPGDDTLSVNNPGSFIELPWTRCIHWARPFWGATKPVTRFSSDCAAFEIPGDQLSDAVRARAVAVFDWQGGNHKPSSKAVGVSLVRDEADPDEPTFMEIRIEERVSGWADAYVYLPSEVAAEGQSGTGLTDKKNRLVSVVSGNYEIGTKRCAVAVLVKQHLQLLNQQSRADSFVPATKALRTVLASAPISTTTSSSTSSTSSVPAATPSSSLGAQGGWKRQRQNP